MPAEIIPQSPTTGEFKFESATATPYVSCPSSPQRFGNHYFSAPTSPTRAAAFYQDHFDQDNVNHVATSSAVLKNLRKNDNADFEFEFVGRLEEPSIPAADELFDGGKIRLLKPSEPDTIKKQDKTDRQKLLSPVEKIKEGDDLAEGIIEIKEHDHGVRKKLKSSSSLERTKSDLQNTKQNKSVLAWYNKLKLKDLLLFRSISEGHKEKYGMLRKRYKEDVKNSSFRSTESGGSVSSRRRVSAHEWHYTANRAAAEEMRKKTFLPYKRGLLGCLGFHAPVVHELSRGFGSYVLRET